MESKGNSWLERVGLALGTVIIIVGVFGEYRFGGRSSDAAVELQRRADIAVAGLKKDANSLADQLQVARTETARADANLLHEQRLTARERWRLERIERAVLPRSLYVNWGALVAKLKAGHFQPTNLAYIGKWEPREFATNLMAAMQKAGMLGKFIELPAGSTDSPESMTSSSGSVMLITNDDGSRLAETLWQEFQIGGASTSWAPPPWSSIPKGENCLVIEENNWAMAPGKLQPGEGIDKFGRPVPAPQ